MKLAVQRQDATKQSYAAVYYILDAALPDTVGAYDVVATYTTPGFRWGHVGVDLIELKNTMQVAPIATGSTAGNTDCGASVDPHRHRHVHADGLARLRRLGRARRHRADRSAAAIGLVETWNQVQASPDHMIGAAAYAPDNDSRTITWTVANCYNSATAIVAVKRLNWN